MPAWMHQRAEHILEKNPSMPKGEAFAIATQQMHALGKSPKNYGTPEGRHEAKAKYQTPEDDKKTAGVLGDLWHAANTPIPGTPTILSGRLGNLVHEATNVAKPAATAVTKTKEQILAARRAAYHPKTAMLESFDSELDAIKQAAEKEKKQKPMSNLKKWGLGTLGGIGMYHGNTALNALSNRQADKDFAGKQELLQKIKGNARVPIVEPQGDMAAFVGRPQDSAHMSAALGEDIPIGPNGSVLLGKNKQDPSVLSHELGHADIHSNRYGRLLQNRATTTLGNAAGVIGGLSGLATGALSDNPTVHRWGIAAPAIAAAPQLLYEAGASLAGIKHMRRAGATGQHMAQYAKTLLPAWGTYATRAGVGVAQAAQMQGIGGGLRNLSKDREKKADGTFQVSQYAGPMGPVRFQQASQIPPFRQPSLARAVEKPDQKIAMLSPAGQLASTQHKGTGFGKAPSGPSIAEVAKPPGMGSPMPGALKNQI